MSALTPLALNALRRMKLNVWYLPGDLGLRGLSCVAINRLEAEGYIEQKWFLWLDDDMPESEFDALPEHERWRYRCQMIRKVRPEPDSPTLEPSEWESLQPLIDKYGAKTLARIVELGRTPAHAKSNVPPLKSEDWKTDILASLRELRCTDGVDYREQREREKMEKKR